MIDNNISTVFKCRYSYLLKEIMNVTNVSSKFNDRPRSQYRLRRNVQWNMKYLVCSKRLELFNERNVVLDVLYDVDSKNQIKTQFTLAQ